MRSRPERRTRLARGTAFATMLTASACSAGFQVKNYSTTNELYRASLSEFERRHWENAISGFEKLTLDLPARDTLLPKAYFYLATAQGKQEEHLLAAQSFTRLAETFPDDSLADDALFEAGMAYERMWRKPQLDATYGESAQGVFRTLISVYPSSPLVAKANEELAKLDDWYATKDYETGMHYFRRKAYDSAILYFKDVIKSHPNAPETRLAYLRLLEAYRVINYQDDATELCTTMRQTYSTDREVNAACAPAPVATGTSPPKTP